MYSLKVALVLLFLRISLHVFGEEEEVLPPYQEYLKRIEHRRLSNTIIPTTTQPSTTTSSALPKLEKLVVDESIAAIAPPLIQLCKDTTNETNLYQQTICWALFALYLMVIVSLILQQLCSLFWMKNGQHSNIDNFETKSANRASISRLLRQ
uniref:Uncharacterized protein n=1 Tax=Globodera rostochiensis TaxID=31243 RepID=A0A914H8U0_GLORO